MVKLPALVSHYFEHKEKDSKMNLLDFISMHYAKKAIKDSDYDRDMQLPFKQCSTPLFLVLTTVSGKLSIILHMPVAEVAKTSTGYKNSFFATDFHNNIWQPPRAC